MRKKSITLKKIELNPAQISVLIEKFYIDKHFIYLALGILIIPPCVFDSKAANIREARIEYYRSGNDSEKQKASVRKIIDLAISEEDAMGAFYLSNDTLEGKLAIRKMAEILFNSELVLN